MKNEGGEEMKLDTLSEKFLEKVVSAYWFACDEQKRAVLPSDLTSVPWVSDLLDEQFELALRIEADVEGWDMARQKY